MPEWGPLARPPHDAAPDAGTTVPWRDNAYVLFWDTVQDVFGTVHVSTSPNAEGRRARSTVLVDGRAVEVMETLAPGTFAGEAIAFGLDGRLTVGHPDLTLDLRCAPRLELADYTRNAVIPEMGGEAPKHYQQTVAVAGTVNGAPVTAAGVRDRTWGYRDESANITEYVWTFVAFDGWSLTAMRFVDGAGLDRTDGFVLREDGVEAVTALGVVRDASGLCAGLELTAGGEPLHVRSTGRRGGLWVPMGSERRGPAMSAYDEFCGFETGGGAAGFGLVEHGTVRKLF